MLCPFSIINKTYLINLTKILKVDEVSKDQDSVNSFIPGDYVVYPSHGVGKIIGTEKRTVEEVDLELLIVRFEHERMTLRVPLSKATEFGLRTLSSKVQMEEAILTLKGKAKVKKTMSVSYTHLTLPTKA